MKGIRKEMKVRLVIRMNSQQDTTENTINTYQYEYDEKGNWLKQYQFDERRKD